MIWSFISICIFASNERPTAILLNRNDATKRASCPPGVRGSGHICSIGLLPAIRAALAASRPLPAVRGHGTPVHERPLGDLARLQRSNQLIYSMNSESANA